MKINVWLVGIGIFQSDTTSAWFGQIIRRLEVHVLNVLEVIIGVDISLWEIKSIYERRELAEQLIGW